MVDILCEGACNPGIAHYDNLARDYAGFKRIGRELLDAESRICHKTLAAMRAELAKLVYTRHDWIEPGMDGRTRARCMRCGTARDW